MFMLTSTIFELFSLDSNFDDDGKIDVGFVVDVSIPFNAIIAVEL